MKNPASFDIVMNPKKKLKRSDLIKMGKMIAEKCSDKNIGFFTLTITDDKKDSPNSVMFPFLITDEK